MRDDSALKYKKPQLSGYREFQVYLKSEFVKFYRRGCNHRSFLAPTFACCEFLDLDDASVNFP